MGKDYQGIRSHLADTEPGAVDDDAIKREKERQKKLKEAAGLAPAKHIPSRGVKPVGGNYGQNQRLKYQIDAAYKKVGL